ncbi:MFS transporter [Chloroflexota bacterium]
MHQAAQLDGAIKRDRIVTVSLFTLCQSVQSLTRNAIALFLPVIRRDLGMSFTQAGTLSAAGTLSYASMQIPSGYLADRFGPKRSFFIGVLGVSTLFLAFGLVSEYWQAIVNQTLAGFFRALLFAPGLALLTAWFPPDRRATALALSGLGGLLGIILLSTLGPVLVAAFDWRFPFLTFPVTGILGSLLFLRFGKEPPHTSKREKVSMLEVFKLFQYRLMWVCGAIQFIRLACMTGITFWLPSLLVDEKGLSLQVTGLIVALRALLDAPSRILGGYASDKMRNPPLIIGLSLLVLAITTPLFVVVNNTIVLVILIAINALFVQLYFGPLFAVPGEVLGTRTMGMSIGFSNLFANIGGLVFAYLVGALKDASGSFESGFYAIGGACAIGLVFTALLAQMRHKAIVSEATEAENN